MSWDAIGAIGQAISAVAVVVTLAFLVVQLRQLAAQTQQNSHAIRFATYSAQANQLSGWQHATALDADLSRILMEAAKATQYGDATFDDIGWLRFSLAYRSIFIIHENLFYQFQAGAIDAPYWAQRCDWLKVLVTMTPALRGWWQREREAGAYIPEFIAAIDAHEPAIRGEYLLKR